MNEINPIIMELLNKRGLTDESEIEEFLSAKPRKTYDPFLLLNMEAGVDLILSVIKKNGRICVYGDYDADGITSVSLLTRVLSKLTDNFTYYVPSRFDEGYGLNKAAISKIRRDGADMLLTVDCGSVSFEEVEYAKEIGLEVVITDHHNITDVIADCIVINPKQPGCGYPFKQLAGAGVAFKVAQAIRTKTNLPKSILTEVLDLVCIGTIGDVVPLIDENRTLTKYGLRELNKLKRVGLKRLIDEVYPYSETLTSESVAFTIVPHLNAAGRMSDANYALNVLISDDEDVINENINILVDSNRNRKLIQEDIFKRCIEIVDNDHVEDKCLLILADDAHEGITGIVAGKIKDKYNKPAIIMTQSEGRYKGTGRSIEGINLYELLSDFKNLFIRFGGHAGACGFLIEPYNLAELTNGLREKTRGIYEKNPLLFDKSHTYDMELSGKEVGVELGELIEGLAPFGNQNMKPVFRVNGVIIKNMTRMGDGRHMRFLGRAPDGAVLQCVLFNKADEYMKAADSNKPVGINGIIEARTWNGDKKARFLVERIVSEE